MPAVMFLAVKSEDIVLVLLGPPWIEAAPLFRILAIAVFVRPIIVTFEQIMISSGKTRRYLFYGILYSISMIAAFTLGINWKATGVAYSYAIVSYGIFIFSMIYCLNGTAINHLIVAKTTMFPIITTLFSGFVLIMMKHVFFDGNAFIRVTVSLFFISIIYLSLWSSFSHGREKLNEFWTYRKELFKKAKF
jgi:O-antigen/teichoic acid export membrane protein